MTIGRYHHGWCRRCKMHKYIKARRLCESCYMQVKAQDGLDQYPTLHPRRRRPQGTSTVDGLCRCMAPIRQHLPLWGTDQCLKCGRKLLVDD